MGTLTELPRSKKSDLTGNQLFALYYENSDCFVVAFDRSRAPRRLEIFFTGAVAKLPSLKNSKIPKTNFLNPDTLARLRAMSALFREACESFDFPINYKNEELWIAVSIADGSRADSDNVFAAIKDWFEPSTKAGRAGKWGVGIVADDANVYGYAVHSRLLGRKMPFSRIIVRPLVEHLESLRAEFFDNTAAVRKVESFISGGNDGNKSADAVQRARMPATTRAGRSVLRGAQKREDSEREQ